MNNITKGLWENRLYIAIGYTGILKNMYIWGIETILDYCQIQVLDTKSTPT